MPVIATPVAPPSDTCCEPLPAQPPVPSLVTCKDLHILSVEPTTRYKKPLTGRIRTLRFPAGQQAVIEWTMTNREGNPVDLSDCDCQVVDASSLSASETSASSADCTYSIKFRLREKLSLGKCDKAVLELDGDLRDGKVRVTIPAAETKYPGIYIGEIAIMAEDGGTPYPYFSNSFYVAIERSAWQSKKDRYGPPSFAEIRLHLRDSDPAENLLLDGLTFDDAEIAFAIERPVMYWNEIPPPIRTYTTQNFPFRYHWLMGIAGELFLIAGEGYRKNHLAYSAAGISIDDQAKEPNYEKAAQMRLQDYRDFVRRKKVEMNVAGGFGEVASDYGHGR